MSLNDSGKNTGTNHTVAAFAVVLGLALFFVCLALGGCSSPDPVIVKAAPAVATAPVDSTATFVVTGGNSDVHYGTVNVDHQDTGPMTRTMAVKDYHGFTITAVLKHAGHVACKILIGGKVVTSSHGNDTAICAVTRDPGTGHWFSLSS